MFCKAAVWLAGLGDTSSLLHLQRGRSYLSHKVLQYMQSACVACCTRGAASTPSLTQHPWTESCHDGRDVPLLLAACRIIEHTQPRHKDEATLSQLQRVHARCFWKSQARNKFQISAVDPASGSLCKLTCTTFASQSVSHAAVNSTDKEQLYCGN